MMAVIDIAIIGLMAIGLVIYVGEPFVRRVALQASNHQDDDTSEHLLLQKETLYVAIRDLDFDFQTGKVDQKDYDELRQELENEAVHLLRKLDGADPLVAFDNAVEQQIRLLRQCRLSVAHSSDRVICAQCSIALEQNENFCPSCGQAVRH